ncbi:EKC/KEOPS complex subunit bud32-like [Schistocerca gregaria]|uniref:EKC/KEOPS complex subunit bud32-like n=1 Tax=Schistocerca gregaria TaxID=7010 RepID=UPI00211E5F99|nr:EKC/KEOPS complex subunit bud32-like [Schistocerca gregaria]
MPKKYRHPMLDAELNTKRLKNEVRTMGRAQKSGVRIPCIYFVDKDNHLMFMERVDGLTLNSYLIYLEEKTESGRLISGEMSKNHDRNSAHACFLNSALYDQQRVYKMLENMTSLGITTKDIARKLGLIIAKLHKSSLVHGDLTTSNIMLTAKDLDIVLIDFGLGMTSSQVECYAVDLYVLERAFSATHPGFIEMYQQILEAYNEAGMKKVIRRLDDVRLRGRKKISIG